MTGQPLHHRPPSTSPAPALADRAELPSAEQADRTVARARRLFNAALSSWTCDLLLLRQQGTDGLSWSPVTGEMEDLAA